MFLPVTKEEIDKLGWDAPDVILVSGDSYIDSPHMGISVIGHILMNAGYRTAIIAQPDTKDHIADIARLGEPKLFWGVSGGAVDSMVANYTASKKPRHQDDYTPGGENNRRPDRAVLVYSNLIRRNFKNTKPIVLGGIEASLRRIAHYDFWSNKVRGSILFDSKADYLMYGMADKSVLELALYLKKGFDPSKIRGLAWKSSSIPDGAIEIPSLDEVTADKEKFIEAYKIFYANADPITGKAIAQKHGEKYLIQNPPAMPLSQSELDAVYTLPFERAQHPYYEKQGKVRALDTIRFSVTTHRGCYGECNFCAIALHEGRIIQWRSEKSILDEITRITNMPGFRGYITDLGGPTANMYGIDCAKKLKEGACRDKRCLFPEPCPALHINHQRQVQLLQRASLIPKVKKIFVASGIRYDMIQADPGEGEFYLERIIKNHTSGQMKVAPEHQTTRVLELMGKPGREKLLKFKADFDRINTRLQGKEYLTYYFMAAHPGCTIQDMKYLRMFTEEQLKTIPEQTQIFTPTPLTWSTLMYYTEKDPFTNQPIYVEKDPLKRQRQKEILVGREDVQNDKFRRNDHGPHEEFKNGRKDSHWEGHHRPDKGKGSHE